MPDPHDHKDDDTTPIKPMMLTGIVLVSAAAGLIAGLLICWLFCCDGGNGEDRQAAATSIENSYDGNATTSLVME